MDTEDIVLSGKKNYDNGTFPVSMGSLNKWSADLSGGPGQDDCLAGEPGF